MGSGVRGHQQSRARRRCGQLHGVDADAEERFARRFSSVRRMRSRKSRTSRVSPSRQLSSICCHAHGHHRGISSDALTVKRRLRSSAAGAARNSPSLVSSPSPSASRLAREASATLDEAALAGNEHCLNVVGMAHQVCTEMEHAPAHHVAVLPRPIRQHVKRTPMLQRRCAEKPGTFWARRKDLVGHRFRILAPPVLFPHLRLENSLIVSEEASGASRDAPGRINALKKAARRSPWA